MSSSYVRQEIESFIENNLPSETLVDFTLEYKELKDMLSEKGLNDKSSFLGIQYIGSDELPVSVFSNNENGKYRETGSIFLHIVSPIKKSAKDDILGRAENVRDVLRGQRIGSILINSVTPPNFESSGTLQFDGGFVSASVIVNYMRDKSL